MKHLTEDQLIDRICKLNEKIDSNQVELSRLEDELKRRRAPVVLEVVETLKKVKKTRNNTPKNS